VTLEGARGRAMASSRGLLDSKHSIPSLNELTYENSLITAPRDELHRAQSAVLEIQMPHPDFMLPQYCSMRCRSATPPRAQRTSVEDPLRVVARPTIHSPRSLPTAIIVRTAYSPSVAVLSNASMDEAG